MSRVSATTIFQSKTILLILFCCYLFSRCLFIPADLPPYSLTQYGSKDEQCYNETAINLYHFGKIHPIIVDEIPADGRISRISQNLMTWASMELLGNNYYGLRGSAVFASILLLLIILSILRNFLSSLKSKNKNLIFTVVLLYFCMDFTFLNASRNAAPTIFRSLFLILIAYYFFKTLRKNTWFQTVHFIILGMLSVFAVFFNYFTNVFIVAALYLTITFLILIRRNRATLSSAVFLTLGMIVGLVLSEMVYQHFEGSGLIQAIKDSFFIYGNRIGSINTASLTGISIKSIVSSSPEKIISLLTTNLFMLNPLFLWGTLCSIPIMIHKIHKQKEKALFAIFIFCLVLSYFAQAAIYNPHASKWIGVIFPVLLIYLVISFNHFKSFWKEIVRNRKIHYYYAYSTLASLFVFLLIYKYGHKGAPEKIGLVWLFLGSILLFSILIHFLVNKTTKSWIPVTILILSFIPNGYYSIKNYFCYPEFHYRDALIALNKQIEKEVVAGSWSYGFRLYTQGNTIYSWYDHLDLSLSEYRKDLTAIFDHNQALYTVDYQEKDFIDVERDINNDGKNYHMIKEASLYLGKGSYRDILVLYKRVQNNIDR